MYQELANGGPRAKSDPLLVPSSHSFCKIFPKSPSSVSRWVRGRSSLLVLCEPHRHTRCHILLRSCTSLPRWQGGEILQTRTVSIQLWNLSTQPSPFPTGGTRQLFAAWMKEKNVINILGTREELEESCENYHLTLFRVFYLNFVFSTLFLSVRHWSMQLISMSLWDSNVLSPSFCLPACRDLNFACLSLPQSCQCFYSPWISARWFLVTFDSIFT